jgi:biopolymer transport protein TolQ
MIVDSLLVGHGMVGDLLACFTALAGHVLDPLLMGAQTARPGSLMAVDFMAMVRKADLVGWLCIGLLLIFSVVSWAIILLKFIHITVASRQTKHFIEQCVASASSLEEAYKSSANYPDSPVSQLLREAYLELEMENWYEEGYEAMRGGRLELARVGIERVLERTISTEIDHLESYLVFLATTSNACPFIGLFGTVWGIMAAFQGLGDQGSVNITALAPGLSTALVTTVAGLFAAIPASVMYNYLTNKVRILTGRMDSFSLELNNIIQKQMAKG